MDDFNQDPSLGESGFDAADSPTAHRTTLINLHPKFPSSLEQQRRNHAKTSLFGSGNTWPPPIFDSLPRHDLLVVCLQ